MPELVPLGLKFKTKLSDLFTSEAYANVGIAQYLSARENVEMTGFDNKVQGVSSLNGLKSVLEEELWPGCSRLFVLNRKNSWSRMDITLEMFQALCSANRVTSHFLKLIVGMGRKRSSSDEDFMSCYSQFSTTEAVPVKSNDMQEYLSNLCYNIRHFELHGRELENPWSCRQTAINHVYDINKEQSNWIVVQPPGPFMSNFDTRDISQMHHSMYLHIPYLTAGVCNWREYLNYIAGKLKELNETIAIYKPYSQFSLDFSSKQKIHNLRKCLHHASSILSDTLEVVATIQTHESTLAGICNLPAPAHHAFQRELRNISSELRSHKQTTRKLLSLSKDTGSMYNDILKLYGQELLHTNGLALQRIAQDDSNDTKTMATIADKSYNDSQMTRFATMIAMFYLPANLVTSFFSTTFVWFDQGSVGKENTSVLRVHPEIWVGVISTLVLVTLTVLMPLGWNRRAQWLGMQQV